MLFNFLVCIFENKQKNERLCLTAISLSLSMKKLKF